MIWVAIAVAMRETSKELKNAVTRFQWIQAVLLNLDLDKQTVNLCQRQAEAVDLLVDLCSYPSLWPWALGSDPKELIAHFRCFYQQSATSVPLEIGWREWQFERGSVFRQLTMIPPGWLLVEGILAYPTGRRPSAILKHAGEITFLTWLSPMTSLIRLLHQVPDKREWIDGEISYWLRQLGLQKNKKKQKTPRPFLCDSYQSL